MVDAKRRLAAIMAADVAGYSRLMGEDEQATLTALDACRDVFRGKIDAHSGRVVDTAGDSVLAIFDSVVEAVDCAVAVQKRLAEQAAEACQDRRMLFRIGVNLGDVLVKDDGSIYGDGVNVAARLEGLAKPGGLVISGSAFDQVDGKLDHTFAFIGEHSVKNIARPVLAYGFGAAGVPEQTATARVESRKPSIAVLPFDNMSGDPDQDYFSDGITEDILTELSRYSSLFVIARNSTFAYKGSNVNIRDVGRELGADYVLEGSVRKAGNRVRITAQLIESETGNHLWAEKYDRNLDDIFALQDEITQMIVAALPRHIESAQLQLTRAKSPSDLAAHDYLLQAKVHHHRGTREDNRKAIELLEKAIDVDPNYAEAQAWRACTIGQGWVRGYIPDQPTLIQDMADDLESALQKDPDNSECLRLMTAVCIVKRDFDKAKIHQERAIALNPNDPRIVSQMGELLTWTGQPEAALEWLELAMRLDPNHGDGRWQHLGQALFVAHRYEEAIEAYRNIADPAPGTLATLAACYASSDNNEAAQKEAARVLAADPGFSTERSLDRMFYGRQADIDHHRDALLKAGLPE